VPGGVVHGWRWGWRLSARGSGSDISELAVRRGVNMGMGMGTGSFCYGCLVGAKRVGTTSGIFLWIDFDYTMVLSRAG
jgi:hypothetical protein